MKIILRIILIAGLAYLAEAFFPWWSVGVVAFAVTALLAAKSSWNAFFSGFFGIGLLWLIMAYAIDRDTDALLSSKIAALFSLTESLYLMLITAAVGGIAGGFASLCGHFFRKLFEKRPSGYYY
jgi:hypothetical protein